MLLLSGERLRVLLSAMSRPFGKAIQRKREDRDPVCGKRINCNKAHITIEYKGNEYPLCCPICQAEFERDPERYLQ
ncbi:MAG: YHS domain-containing protein [Candidatus Accumulibacter meliphilus]|uniref:YHS domain-containing protein n=1 Tax=Candidatus Accumulibacter meliphilus TaxID=2211374 RepID=UPI002FC3867C